jgi:hypothetical protein
MHDVFQSIRNSLRQNRRKAKKCLRRINFLTWRRIDIDFALNERRFHCNHWVKNRLRFLNRRNSVLFCHFNFALKRLNWMIIIAINAFFIIRSDFTRFFVMLLEINWTSSFISTNVNYVIISLTMKILLDSTIINKKLVRNMRVLVS